MKCSNCGHELPEDVNFCSFCGTTLIKKESQNKEVSSIEADGRKKTWLMIELVIILLIVVIIILCFCLVMKNLPSESEAVTYKTTDDMPTITEHTEDNSVKTAEDDIMKLKQKKDEILSNIKNGQYSQIRLNQEMMAYVDGTTPQHIMVYKENPEDEIDRKYYYYSNGKLILAYYENNMRAKKDFFYFVNDKLIYHNDDNNPSQQIEESDFEKSYWENKILEDSNSCKKEVSAFYTPFDMKNIDTVYASSELFENNISYLDENVLDGVLSTAWVEGVIGQGIGEEITLYFNGNYYIKGFEMNAGYHKSMDLYKKNSRPKCLRISYSDGSSELCELKDVYGKQKISLNNRVKTSYLTFTIESVYPGNKYEDTAISEISLY